MNSIAFQLGRVSLALAVAGLVLGCVPRRPRPDVTHPDLSVRIPSYVRAVEQGDHSVLPRLVDDLEDSDPAVRLYAIQALGRLTGNTFDYKYFEEESQRRQSVQQWRQWLEQREP